MKYSIQQVRKCSVVFERFVAVIFIRNKSMNLILIMIFFFIHSSISLTMHDRSIHQFHHFLFFLNQFVVSLSEGSRWTLSTSLRQCPSWQMIRGCCLVRQQATASSPHFHLKSLKDAPAMHLYDGPWPWLEKPKPSRLNFYVSLQSLHGYNSYRIADSFI